MLKRIGGALGVILLAIPSALAQEDVDAGLFDQGEQLYGENCAVCHQAEGTGLPPAFPALAGNDNLADVELILTTISQGRNDMPPFSHFAAADLAAVATYIRNAWGNEFGGVSVEDASAAADDSGEGGERVSIWDGVYTQEQAERGGVVLRGNCGDCHGPRGDTVGALSDMPAGPPIAGPAFLREWDGQTIAALYEYSRTRMPTTNPGALSDQQYIDAIAYMLELSGAPAGDEELAPDTGALAGVVIEQQP